MEAGDRDDGDENKDNDGDIDDDGDKDYGVTANREGMAENDRRWGKCRNNQPGGGAAATKAEFFRFHADAAPTLTSSGRTTQASGRVSAGSTRRFAHCEEGNDCQRRRNCLLHLTMTKTTMRTTLVMDREGRAHPIPPTDPTYTRRPALSPWPRPPKSDRCGDV